jgi:hypothetical protein
MAARQIYPHIVKDDGSPARLESHPRIRVAQIVMDYIAYGWSVDEMCNQHPYLTPAEGHAAMAYYYDHQPEIDDEIAREVKEVEEARAKAGPSPFFLKLRSKGLI